MKTKVIGLLIMAGGALCAQPQYPAGPGYEDQGAYPPQGSYESQGAYPPQGSYGSQGAYPPQPAYPQAPYGVGVRPPIPGPGYVWIDGYYDAYSQFIPGYWALPPYSGAFWIGPRFFGGRWSAGYWGGPRGFVGGYRGGFRSGVNERFRSGAPRAEFRGRGGQQFSRRSSPPVQGGGRGGRPAQGGHGHR